MATRKKYYTVMRFETKEDFDKHIDSIYNSGYDIGYKDGMTVAVSYIFECLDHFSPDMQGNAVWMNEDRHKKMWRYFMTANQDDPATKESREIYERMFSRKKDFQKIKEDIEKELNEKNVI